MLRYSHLIPVLAFAVACGGSKSESKTADHDAEHEHGEGEGGEHHEEHSAVPEVAAFHDVLAPLWHDKAQAKDWAGVCAGTKDLTTHADAIVASKSADKLGDRAQTFRDAATQLSKLSTDLDSVCSQKGDVEGALKQVHEQFHKVMELSKP
ncbi:MAG: hypothetical protein U0271_01490 [Polyangiaceae bacterium]